MTFLKRCIILLVVILAVSTLSGCSTLVNASGALIGTGFGLLGKAISIAKKLPWWMWL